MFPFGNGNQDFAISLKFHILFLELQKHVKSDAHNFIHYRVIEEIWKFLKFDFEIKGQERRQYSYCLIVLFLVQLQADVRNDVPK